jgi:transglutaminase-like putative cysteine protease
LLAALLRANRIPAGLCYQRLAIEGETPPMCLHGLNAVYLQEFGWYRIDPRGNREGINAQFSPPLEQLAFSVRAVGEQDLQTIYIRPLPVVVRCLQSHDTWDAVCRALPDAPSETASL